MKNETAGIRLTAFFNSFYFWVTEEQLLELKLVKSQLVKSQLVKSQLLDNN